MAPRLTTTSYALLGLLNMEPFSAYELTKYMGRSALARLWPRTEASVYKEPKTLVAHGLARARKRRTGRRTRTVYEITPAGRRAFQQWLREPAGGITFECEAAVKAFFGDAGDLETLRAHLTSLREGYRLQRETFEDLTQEWLDGRLRFPQRLQYTALAGELIARIEQAVGEWAEDWLERIAEWEDTGLHSVSEEQARSLLGEAVRSRNIPADPAAADEVRRSGWARP